VDTGHGSLLGRVEERLWPLVEAWAGLDDVAGLAVAVVRDDEVVARGFGVRDVRTHEPVTAETMFHLASVSKPFVATALVPLVDLDAPVTRWVPELELADGRADEVTARLLLSHTSGLPDVTDYGWHEPRLGDDALVELVRSLSGWRLRSEPGSTFAYSNAGYELLGLQLARAAGTTFEEAVRRELLVPLGMERSTFLRADVPPDLAASPHVGMPPVVPGTSYPYTRRHAPSSTLHSDLTELCRWLAAHLGGPGPRIDGALLELLSEPVVAVGVPPWDEHQALGWAVGTHDGHRTLSHSGADPGFGSRLALVPDRRTGVAVLANSNTVPVSTIARAALDVALDAEPSDGVTALRDLLPSGVATVARTLATSGPEAAAAELERLAAADPPTLDVDDDLFVDAVWGAIELHRTDLVRPLLRLWTDQRPGSSAAWTMTGWAHQVEGDHERGRALLTRALELDPANEEAAALLGVPRDAGAT
jgi:CubicO group peptidase (beta-lactamase class C family)